MVGDNAAERTWRGAAALALMTTVAFINAAPSVALHDDSVFAPVAQRASWARIVAAFRQDTWVSAGRPPAGTYRPLFLALMQIEGLLFGDVVRALHVTAIGLHVLMTLVLFGFLERVLRDAWPGTGPLGTLAAWIAALIFGVHPVHTEAVDSFFNASEIIAALGTYGALWLVWAHADGRPMLAWAGASAIYFTTLLCRESAATMPALFVLALGLLRQERTLRERAHRLRPVLLLLIPFGVYALVRAAAAPWPEWAFSSRLENYLALRSWRDRIALVASTMADAWKLMVWPHPLRISYDEYAAHDVVRAVALNAAVLALAAASNLGLFQAEYRADPANGRAASFLVQLYTSLHRTRDAVQLCDRYLSAHPADVFMCEECAGTYETVGREDDALAALRRAADAERGPHTFTLLARLYLKRGERARAEDAYQSAVERSGNALARHVRRGEMLLRMHPERAAEAEAEFQAALELDPHSDAARDWLRAASALVRRTAPP